MNQFMSSNFVGERSGDIFIQHLSREPGSKLKNLVEEISMNPDLKCVTDLLSLRRMAQFAKCSFFDLSDPFSANAELMTNLLQSARIVVINAKP
jgi:hypothetical protein